MTVVGLNYGFTGQMKVDEITGRAPYGATTIAGLDAYRQPSENELAGARYQGRAIARPPRNSTAERCDQNVAGRWLRRPRNRAERVLAAWKRSPMRKTDDRHNARLLTSWRDVISHSPRGIPCFDGTVLIRRTTA
jgi:hypothetical protein